MFNFNHRAIRPYIFVAVSAVVLAVAPYAPPASAAATPTAVCTNGMTSLTIRTGGGIPLPPTFSNPTASAVTFTMSMTSNYFFGPGHDIGTVTLQGHTGETQAGRALPTYLYTPMGNGYVVINIRTNKTGTALVGQCNYQLHLLAPPPTTVFVGIKQETRWMRQVPVLFCALEGSAVAGIAKPGQLVRIGNLLTAISAADATIWYPQAQIALSTPTDSLIPVIADPVPFAQENFKIGDVDLFAAAEPKDAAESCNATWQRLYPGRVGIPVVAARRFPKDPAALAATSRPPVGLEAKGAAFGSGTRGDALCGSPVKLLPADLDKRVTVFPDSTWQMPDIVAQFAHEMGHNLYLGHGNGLDDDSNGRLPGFAGPRRYDEFCDPAGSVFVNQSTSPREDIGSPMHCSLMQQFACSKVLTPLQVETARGVAQFIPGFVDGTPPIVVGP